jgi:hypothetical protein
VIAIRLGKLRLLNKDLELVQRLDHLVHKY